MDRIYSFSCDSFMANRMGLDATMLHYLAVQKAMAYTDPYIRNLGFDQGFLCAYSKKLSERAPTKKTATCTVDYRSTTCVGTSTIQLRSIKSSLPLSLSLRHSRDKLFQALYSFSVLQATESWAGPGNEANGLVL